MVKKLDFAERWLRSGIEACHVPAFYEFLDVDMAGAGSLIGTARTRGVRITYTHVIVRAVALALARNPDLHVMVCGQRSYQPGTVDIALSIAGDSAAAPLLVIRDAASKSLPKIARDIISLAARTREADRKMTSAFRRWGWLLPLSRLRKRLLRALFANYRFRRQGAGTFQVSVLPEVDSVASPIFSSSAMLFAGGVREKVVPRNGTAVIRPTMTISCCADHRIWDGRAAQRFLVAVREALESEQLDAELASSECSTTLESQPREDSFTLASNGY